MPQQLIIIHNGLIGLTVFFMHQKKKCVGHRQKKTSAAMLIYGFLKAYGITKLISGSILCVRYSPGIRPVIL